MMSSASVMNPLPTKDPRQDEHTKQSLCQCRPSKEMNRVPPMPKIHAKKNAKNPCKFWWIFLPVMGLEQAVQRLEKSSPKHSAQ